MGNVYLSAPAKEKEFECGESSMKKIRYAAAGMQGWRKSMEDAHISKTDLGEDIHLFAVFDGHGGREVARYAQRHFAEELLKNLNFNSQKYVEALQETFLRMDQIMNTPEGRRELTSLSASGEEQEDYYYESMAGCTANVVLIVKDVIYCANAGDSRSVLCDSGKAVELSEDHKPENSEERERIQAAGGWISDGRINGNLNLSRALGDFEFKKNLALNEKQQLVIAWPDVKVRNLKQSAEYILMGCDGIWESLTNEEMVDYTRKLIKDNQDDLRKSVEDLLEKMVAPDTSTGLGCDNMTCILIKLK
eukprot:TRINITY_DN265_c0_g1_i1.p1 TRINITY_DN265_c0_g1~~TRINITY_DN265_c0_g1_i1.p1  ORF type:complete len:306 (-),score=84.30 TRINITY_DN265_c0_g1_i1:232-1149(-)